MTDSPSRQEIRHQRREQIDQRQRSAEESARRRSRNRRLRTGGIIGVAAALLIGILTYAVSEVSAPIPGESVADEGRSHVELGSVINYNNNPPSSGPHYPVTGAWRFNDSPVQPGFWVHNLEHGGIVILYRCPADCTQLKAQLRTLTETLPRSARFGTVKLLVTPDDSISATLAVLAWNRRLMLDRFDEPAIARFYQAYLDKGPEAAG